MPTQTVLSPPPQSAQKQNQSCRWADEFGRLKRTANLQHLKDVTVFIIGCVLHTIFYKLQILIQVFGRNAGLFSHIFPGDPWKKALLNWHCNWLLGESYLNTCTDDSVTQAQMQDRDTVLLQGVFKVPRETGKCALPFPLRISRKVITVTRGHPGDCLSYLRHRKWKRAELAHYFHLRKEIHCCMSTRKETPQS